MVICIPTIDGAAAYLPSADDEDSAIMTRNRYYGQWMNAYYMQYLYATYASVIVCEVCNSVLACMEGAIERRRTNGEKQWEPGVKNFNLDAANRCS